MPVRVILASTQSKVNGSGEGIQASVPPTTSDPSGSAATPLASAWVVPGSSQSTVAMPSAEKVGSRSPSAAGAARRARQAHTAGSPSGLMTLRTGSTVESRQAVGGYGASGQAAVVPSSKPSPKTRLSTVKRWKRLSTSSSER